MTVRCAQCGQENNPQYRFCGMCGAPLGPPPSPVPGNVGRERVRVPVSGPSFLGLGDERYRDLDYLLEDEPVRGHGRLYLALLLLTVSAALLAWHWQRDGYPWWDYFSKPAASNHPTLNSPAAAPDSASAPDSAAAAAPAAPAEPTANPAPPETHPATADAATPPATEPAAAGSSLSPVTAASPATAAGAGATKPGGQTSPSEVSDAGDGAPKPAAESPQEEESEDANPAPKPAHTSLMPKAASPKPSPAVPPATFEDRLVADGEKYLYGRGVPQDCERAQRNLQIGARQSNARAETLLGAMYATGHCVSRDLPTAYRWFASALHADPGNSRVQQDLEVLWKQMTPEERQLAMRNQ